jgi:hypothetical protein
MTKTFADDHLMADLSEDDVIDVHNALTERLRGMALTDAKKPWHDSKGLHMICYGFVGDTYGDAPTIGGWLRDAAKKMGLSA